ncbi:MAG: HD domain-containing phosphohydrolase [Acetivibrionales bacterium]|jgi:diguanylate cyclase (GGDEF)-like protein/PAS domain S-box-containing protein
MNKKRRTIGKSTIRKLAIYITILAILLTLVAFYLNIESKNTITPAILFTLSLLIIMGISALYGKKIKAERKQLKLVNKKLKESERLLKTFFNQSPVGIALGESKFKLIDVNPKFEEIMGRSKKELKETTWVDFIHPDDLQADLNNIDLLYEGKIDGYSMRKRFIRPDGSIVWVNMTMASLTIDSESGNHICIIEDISEQKKIEEELFERERSMAMLFSNLPGMAYRCKYDRDWTMLFVSEGCYELTGYKPESLLHNKDITYNLLINEEYREYLWEKWTRVLKEKVVFKEEYYITTASGEKKWVFEQGRGVYKDNGEVEAIEGLIIDISVQKEREEQILYLTYHDVLTGLYNRRYFEEEKKRLDMMPYIPLSIIVGDINGLKLINDALGHSAGDKLIKKISEILVGCCNNGEIIARIGGDEFGILLPNTGADAVYKKMKQIEKACSEYRGKKRDDPYHTSISLGCATRNSMGESLIDVIRVAEEYMYRDKLLQNRSLHSSIISSMKITLFEKSQETEEHAQRMIKLSRAIGKEMNLKDEQLNELELLSTLHDIGKIGISDAILNKPGKLTDEEWQEMKKHPTIGYRIAMSSPELAPIAEYILYHHERWDGKGYPNKLKGEEIPLLSRILAVVDAYDAMTQDRSYRKAMTKEAAIEEIRANIGKQFDPNIARIFIEKIS